MNLWSAPKVPASCKILVFHGKPDPGEAINGYRGTKIHHFTKAAQWIEEYWNDDAVVHDNEET